MKLSRPLVERDFVSGTNLTYLETFVIEDLVKRTIRVEKLNSTTIEENMNLVRNLDLVGSPGKMLQSARPELLTMDRETGFLTTQLPNQFSELTLVSRLLEEDWRDPETDDEESIVQMHRNAVFPDDINYTPLP
jgi:hypothetical protein